MNETLLALLTLAAGIAVGVAVYAFSERQRTTIATSTVTAILVAAALFGLLRA